MKKKIILGVAAAASFVVSIVCFFLPFIKIELYKPITGFQLMFNMFRRFTLQKTGDAYNTLVFTSKSLPLALTFVGLLFTIVMFILYVRKKDAHFLNRSLVGMFITFVLYGVQLSNSNTLISDFFGTLLKGVPAGNGLIFQTADTDGLSIGLAPKLLVITFTVAFLALVALCLSEYIERVNKTGVRTPASIAITQYNKSALAKIGMVIIAFFIIFCFFGPIFSKYALLQTDIGIASNGPSLNFIFGTDNIGRDILTRLMYGGRISLTVGFTAVLLEVVIGTTLGGVAGYYVGAIDNAIMRVDDIFLCLPYLPVVIILGAVMADLKIDPQQRIYIVMFILGALGWPGLARLVRGQILSLREQEFMVAEEALGIRDRHKIMKHLIPNAFPNVIVYATLDVGNMIIAESTLSFLGLGVSAPYPSWGNIIKSVQDPNDFAMRPWLWIPAGICILLVVIAINFVGDGLRDALDPKMKR